jgi:phosphate transport system substrate-binding protein
VAWANDTCDEVSVGCSGMSKGSIVFPAAILCVITAALPVMLGAAEQKITVGGAQSLTTLAEKFSAQFRKEHPGLEIEIRRANSNYAVDATRNGQIQIGLVGRSLSPAEKYEFRVEPLGHDAIIFLSYSQNTVAGLSLEQLQQIYLGQITNWKEVGGEDKGIVALTREASSPLHKTFIESLFGQGFRGQEKAFILRAKKENVLKTIKRIRGSLAYGLMALEEAEAEGVKVLAINGKIPSAVNITDKLYPFTRPLFLISNDRPEPIIQEWMSGFAKFVKAGKENQSGKQAVGIRH